MNGLGLKNYPKLTHPVLESAFWFQSYGKVVFHCQLMCTVTSRVDWPRKTTSKWLFKCWNLPTGYWVMVRSSSVVSWCVQRHHEWTGLEKLPQIDPSSVGICLLVPELWWGRLPLSADVYTDIMSGLASKNYPKLIFKVLESAFWFLSYGKVVFHGQLMCTVTSRVDWARKTTPKWLLKHQNRSTGSKVRVKILKWCDLQIYLMAASKFNSDKRGGLSQPYRMDSNQKIHYLFFWGLAEIDKSMEWSDGWVTLNTY